MSNAFASGLIFVNIVSQEEKAVHRKESINHKREEKHKQANILTIRQTNKQTVIRNDRKIKFHSEIKRPLVLSKNWEVLFKILWPSQNI